MTAIPKPILAVLIGLACGPSDDPGPDPDEVFAEFCANLFSCPETTNAIGTYDSEEHCEDLHRMDHDDRDATCRSRVLALESCVAALTCQELEDYIQATGSPCDEERLYLLEECAPL